MADDEVGIASLQHPQSQAAPYQVRSDLEIVLLMKRRKQGIEEAGVADARGRGENDVARGRPVAGTARDDKSEEEREEARPHETGVARRLRGSSIQHETARLIAAIMPYRWFAFVS
jgi:hypothetical protein